MKGKISEDKVVNVAVYILLAFVGIVTLYPFITQLYVLLMTGSI